MDQEQRYRRRRAGRASFNMALTSLGIIAAGYVLGFLLPWALSAGRHSGMGSILFLPVGGFAGLFVAIMAIRAAVKVKKFIQELTPTQEERLSSFIDIEKQKSFARYAVYLAVGAIAFNPLIAFMIITLIRRS